MQAFVSAASRVSVHPLLNETQAAVSPGYRMVSRPTSPAGPPVLVSRGQ